MNFFRILLCMFALLGKPHQVLSSVNQVSWVETIAETAKVVQSTVSPDEFPDLTLTQVISIINGAATIPDEGIKTTIHDKVYKGNYFIPCFFFFEQLKKNTEGYKVMNVESISTKLGAQAYEIYKDTEFNKGPETRRLPVLCKKTNGEAEQAELVYKTCLYYTLTFAGTVGGDINEKFEFILFRNKVNADTKIFSFANEKNFQQFLE